MAEQDDKVIVEGKPVQEETTTKVYDKSMQSGLGRMMSKMNPQDVKIVDPVKPAEESPATKSADETKYDYSIFKDLSEKDIAELKTKWSDVPEQKRYEYINAINDVKKNQRLASERQVRIESLEKNTDSQKYNQFLEELKKDFVGTYEKYKDEFDLPALDVVKNQVTTGGFQARLAQWQEKDLIPSIEKKHKLEEGTFVYEPEDAYKAGTPSYDYRVQTLQKEKSFLDEDSRISKATSEAMAKIEEARVQQLAELKQTYFPTLEGDSEDIKALNEKNEQTFIAMLSKIDEMGKSMKEGKFDPESNPFALKNIFRGVHFDSLVKQAVDAAVSRVHEKYQKFGLHLPANEKDMPNDLTKINGKPDISPANEAKLKRSPMARSIARTIN